MTGSITDAAQLARREQCTERQINLTLPLAFLSPQLVKAAVEGRLPRGINIERLRDPAPDWATQFCVRERRPPFSPTDVCLEFSAALKSYGIGSVQSDK
jgi:hypothetical protein